MVLINTGVLNWFGGTYDTDQQPRAPMDPNTFHVSIGASDGFEFLFLTDGFLLSLVKSIFRHQVYLHTLAAPGVWLFTLVSLVAALLPDVVIRQILLIFTSCADNLNQGAEEALDDNRARGANCKVNIALFRSQFFHKSILFKSRRSAERKAKRGSYELRGLQNLGYTEHR